jgi:hypothetical protein
MIITTQYGFTPSKLATNLQWFACFHIAQEGRAHIEFFDKPYKRNAAMSLGPFPTPEITEIAFELICANDQPHLDLDAAIERELNRRKNAEEAKQQSLRRNQRRIEWQQADKDAIMMELVGISFTEFCESAYPSDNVCSRKFFGEGRHLENSFSREDEEQDFDFTGLSARKALEITVQAWRNKEHHNV